MKNFRIYLLTIALILTTLLVVADPYRHTVWAQPAITSTPLPITAISHPKQGDAIAGYATFIGSTLTRNCLKYALDISVAGRENWQTLIVDYRCVANDELFRLDSKQYKDGYYDFRLRAIRNDGNFEEAFLRAIEIRNSFPPTPTPVLDENGLPFLDANGTPIPQASPTEFPISTPTLRPAITHQIPGGQGFYKPEIGETVRGYVDIVGTVYGFPGREFKRYDLFISPRGMGQWTWLYTSNEQLWQSTLYVLDSTQVPDGYYDLMLRNVYADSNYDEFILRYVRILNRASAAPGQFPITTIAQPGILSPQSNQYVRGVVEVRGSTVDPNFLRWELYWSPAGSEQWSYLTSNTKTATGGVMAKLDINSLVGTTIDLRMRLVRRDTNYSEYFVRRLTVLSGSPLGSN